MNNNTSLVVLSFLLTFLILTLGCTENIQVPPFTTSQFVNQTTDANYTIFKLNGYDGMCVVVDGNKLNFGNCAEILFDANLSGSAGQIPFVNADGNALELGGIDFNKDTNTLMVHGQIFSDYGLYVGDVSSATNNYAIHTGTGQVSFGDDVSVDGNINLDGYVRTTANDYSLFGDTTGVHATLIPLTGRDNLYSAMRTNATSGNIRAGFFIGGFNGSSSSSALINGINAFATTQTGATGALTGTIQGGGLRNRYVIRHDGSGVVSMASGLSSIVVANGGDITKASNYFVESPNVTSGKTITDFAGLRVAGGTVSGTITNRYGVKVDSLLGGTTKWGVYVDSDDSYFGGDLRVDGNIVLKSPDGNSWNCGVDNSGVFSCS